MGKPWEKYQQSSARGPWEKYGAAQTPPSPTYKLGEDILDEAADVSGRTKVKWFANSDDSAMKELRKQNPNHDFDLVDGDIIAKKKGEAQWKKLDPGLLSWGGIKDIPQDIADVGYDVASGTVEGIGTLAAGAAGGLVGGVPGALLAGSAASGALSAGNEAMRQKIGQWAGLDQDVDWGQVGVAGAIGAGGGLLLGPGAAAATMGAEKLGIKALQEKAAQKLVAKSGGKLTLDEATKKLSEGALSKAYNAGTRKFLPHLGGALSGGEPGLIAHYGNDMENLDLLGVDGGEAYSTDVAGKLNRFLKKLDKDNGQAIGDIIDNSNVKIKIKGHKEDLKEMAGGIESALENGSSPSGAEDDLANVNRTFQKLFGRTRNPSNLAITDRELAKQADEKLAREMAVYEAQKPEQIRKLLAYRDQMRNYRQLGGDAKQSVINGITEGGQKTSMVPINLELNGKDPALLRSNLFEHQDPSIYEPVWGSQLNLFGLPDVPTPEWRNVGPLQIQGQGTKALGDVKPYNVVGDLQKKFMDDRQAAWIARYGQQGEMFGTELTPRSMGQGMLTQVVPESGQVEAVLRPERVPKLQKPKLDMSGRTPLPPGEIADELTMREAQGLLNRMVDPANFSGRGLVDGTGKGLTPPERGLMNTVRSYWADIDDQMKTAAEGLGDKKDVMRQWREVQNKMARYFKDDQTTLSTLRNLNKKTNTALYNDFAKMDKQFGTNFLDMAKNIQTIDLFANAKFMPVSSGGTTSTTRTMLGKGLGGAAGWVVGRALGGTPGGYAGMTVGGMFGDVLGSPGMIKNYIRGGRMLEAQGDQIPLYLRNNALLNAYQTKQIASPWQLMDKEPGENK